MNQTKASFPQINTPRTLEGVKYNFGDILHKEKEDIQLVIPGKCASSTISPPLLLPSSSSSIARFSATSQNETLTSPYSVIIGRGKKCQDHIGNKRLEALAGASLLRYKQAKGKAEKSEVVSYMIKTVHDAGGTFFKVSDDGRYAEASALATREKIGVVFRNLLSEKYKSSCKSKVVARRHRLERRQAFVTSSRQSYSSAESATSCNAVQADACAAKPVALTGCNAVQAFPSDFAQQEPTTSEQLLSCAIVLDLPGDDDDNVVSRRLSLSSEYSLDGCVGSLDTCWDKDFLTSHCPNYCQRMTRHWIKMS